MTRRRTAFIIACAVPCFALGPGPGRRRARASRCRPTCPSRCATASRSTPTSTARKTTASYPVLLQRTPYNKDGDRRVRLSAPRARLRGHHPGRARTLHVRGRVAHVQARARRRGTTRWSGRATLPYFGWQRSGCSAARYVGATQMLAAIAHPPHLAGICPVVTASNYHSNWTYQGGAFSQWFNRVVDVRAGAGHHRPQHARQEQRAQGHDAVAARQLPAVQSAG